MFSQHPVSNLIVFLSVFPIRKVSCYFDNIIQVHISSSKLLFNILPYQLALTSKICGYLVIFISRYLTTYKEKSFMVS